MNEDIEKKYQRLRALFFGLCILMAGMLLLATAKNITKSVSAENWRVYTGVVDGGGESKKIDSDFRPFRTAWLKYSYEIDGKKYNGTRIGYGISNTDDVQQSGSSLRVYINPEDYAESVLVTGVKRSHIVALIMGLAFLWLAFYLWRRTGK